MALGDFVMYKDAITKMQYATSVRDETGQPFFLVTGVKRPHLNWRMPEVSLRLLSFFGFLFLGLCLVSLSVSVAVVALTSGHHWYIDCYWCLIF